MSCPVPSVVILFQTTYQPCPYPSPPPIICLLLLHHFSGSAALIFFSASAYASVYSFCSSASTGPFTGSGRISMHDVGRLLSAAAPRSYKRTGRTGLPFLLGPASTANNCE